MLEDVTGGKAVPAGMFFCIKHSLMIRIIIDAEIEWKHIDSKYRIEFYVPGTAYDIV